MCPIPQNNRRFCVLGLDRLIGVLVVSILPLAAVSEQRALSQLQPLQRWELRYPVPPDLSKIVFGGGLFLGTPASGVGAPFTSVDGMTWSGDNIQFGSWDAGLTGIAYGNGAFYAVTGTGEVFTARDGTNWTSLAFTPVVDLDADHNVHIAAGNGILLTLSQEGLVSTSVDGITWTVPDSLGGEGLDLWFGNGTFVALISNPADPGGAIYASLEGVSWWSLAGQITGHVVELSFSEGLFVAVTDRLDVLTSPNGLSWSALGSVPSTPGAVPLRFLYGGGGFAGLVLLQGGAVEVVASMDGLTWDTTLSVPAGHDLAYGNGRFVLIGADTYTSADGLIWTKHPGNYGALPSSIAFGNGRFIAVGGNKIIQSTTGTSWSPVPTPGLDRLPVGIYFANDLFLGPSWPSYSPAGGQPSEGCLLTSPDGLTWTEHLGPPFLSSLRSIVYGNGRFVAVGEGNWLYSSTDGIDWSPAVQAEFLTRVVFGNGLFLASSYTPGATASAPSTSALYRSFDGMAWTKLPIPADMALTLRSYGSGVFVAQRIASYSRYVLSSTDGGAWTTRFIGKNLGFLSTAYAGYGAGYFVLLSPSAVLSSADSVSWNEQPVVAEVDIAEEALHPALAFGKGTFVTIVRGKIQQSEPVNPPFALSVRAQPSRTSDAGSVPGKFTLTRTGDAGLGIDLRARFSLGGTAENGADYSRVQEFAIIRAGDTSVSIEIAANLRSLERASKTATLTLLPDDNYRVQDPGTATITIDFAGLPPQVANNGVSRDGDGNIHLAIESFRGAEFSVEASADLINWSHVTNFVSPTGFLEFRDLDSSHNQRFYRIMPAIPTSTVLESDGVSPAAR